MRQLQIREEEFVCLKALAFLHPEAKGLSAESQMVFFFFLYIFERKFAGNIRIQISNMHV